MGKGFEKTRFCKLSSKDLEDDGHAFVELVSKPKFVCMKCHRVSGNKNNLCKPEKLKKLKKGG
jgi:hypothetical protein